MKIEGLITATFCPFNPDGSLNISLIPIIVEKAIADGLTGVFVCGTNGEGPNLTIEERMSIAEEYVKVVDNRILVIVHVGHNSIAESRKLAKHAVAIGADAISSVASFYFKLSSVYNLVESIAAIAAAAPDLPFYYYHIPALTGVAMDMVEFLKLGEELIPNLAGIKYTASTLHEYQACLNYKNGKFDILFGYDEMLLSALSVGAKGAVGSTYNFAAGLYLQIMNLYRQDEKEAARKLQLTAVEMVRCLVQFPSLPAQRAIMKMIGLDLGTCRLPLKELSEKESNLLKAGLEAIDFFAIVENCRGPVKKVLF